MELVSNHINGDCFLDEKQFSVFTIHLKKNRGFITQDPEMWKGQKKKKSTILNVLNKLLKKLIYFFPNLIKD